MLITTILTVLLPVFALALAPSIVGLVRHEREKHADAVVHSLRGGIESVVADGYSTEAA